MKYKLDFEIHNPVKFYINFGEHLNLFYIIPFSLCEQVLYANEHFELWKEFIKEIRNIIQELEKDGVEIIYKQSKIL